MTKPPNVCLFCGQTGNMSKQHVLPDRLKKVLPPFKNVRQSEAWENLREGSKNRGAKKISKKRTGSTGNSHVRKVCKPCNEGWLNIMEQDCVPVLEPLIRGETPVLFPETQIKLARIATSMAMAAAQMRPSRQFTSQSDRETFRETLTPPAGWYVFIGRNLIDYGDPVITGDAGVESAEPGGPGDKLYESSTIILQSAVLHVLSVDPRPVFPVDVYARDLRLAPIWPTTGWINTGAMPFLGIDEIASIRTYMRDAFRRSRLRTPSEE